MQNWLAFRTGIVYITTANGPISGHFGPEKQVGTLGKFRASWHKDLRATAVYVEELSLEEKKQLLDRS